VRTAVLEVRAMASLQPFPRVGLIVPRYRHTAVARNQVKRRLRELARLELLGPLQDAPPLDVVVRALPAAYDRDYDALRTEVRQLLRKLALPRRTTPDLPPANP
jgi:ribonuclease P protein component